MEESLKKKKKMDPDDFILAKRAGSLHEELRSTGPVQTNTTESRRSFVTTQKGNAESRFKGGTIQRGGGGANKTDRSRRRAQPCGNYGN